MTENNDIEIDINKMQARVDARHKAAADKSWEDWERQQAKVREQEAEYNDLYAKAIISDRQDMERKRDEEIKAAKVKADKEIQKQFEAQGIKSERTKILEQGYASLVNNLTGLDD